ncbi:unnamed protein product [Rhizoctonia solani]|uniref:Uncharacterized protein n=1 Tax=Rhizoctonia solani TaxID=456999 RepID=A0A8H3C4Z3_9AGAM|nr:unnamed protein product [Rhizoctonia solani]
MGFFSDDEHGGVNFVDEGSEAMSNADDCEDQNAVVGQAVPTTGNAFDFVDMSQLTTPPALLAFAEGCCEEYKLSPTLKDDVMRTAALPGTTYMSIRLYARIMAMGQEVTKTRVEEFLKSNTFKETIKRRIQGGLLDPNIPYYVRGCTARFVRHMRENPSAYEIPQVVQEGLMTTKKFSSAVGEILSSFRGELRRKIFGSIEDKTDIASTGEKLAIQGYQLSEDHLKKFALLRHISQDYIEAETEAQAKRAMEKVRNRGKGKKAKVDGGPQKALAFWSYVDTQMSRFHKFPPPKRNEVLKHMLRQDRKKYPDRTKQTRWFPPGDQLIVSRWQADASYAVQVMAGYTLTAAQEGREGQLSGPGAGEDGDHENPPAEDEEDGTNGGDEGDSNQADGTGTNDDEDDPPFESDDAIQPPEEDQTMDDTGAAPTLDNSGGLEGLNSSRSNNGPPGNHTPQRQGQRGPGDSVGPIRGTPGLQGDRVGTLAQSSRASPFPSSSRTSTPQPSRALASGAPKNTGSGGPNTRSKTGTGAGAERLPVIHSYNPTGSETAAASVGI